MSKIRVLTILADGSIIQGDGAAGMQPPPEGCLCWIDVEGQTKTEMASLAAAFGFHPLTIEDCLHLDQRPKIEEYDGYLFIVLHAFACTEGSPIGVELEELHVFLGRNYLVTVHSCELSPLSELWKRACTDLPADRRGVDFLFYLLADAMVDSSFPIIDRLSEELEEIEESVLARHEKSDLTRIFALKRTFVLMRKVLSPQRDVFAWLAKRGEPWITERAAFYLRDVYDHLVRLYESIDTGRDLLGNVLEAYLSAASNRTNEIMKRLTLLSAVFMPLTFVTGFFGQNFEQLPFGSRAVFFSVIAAYLVLPGAMVVWFKRSGWF